ncbi:MAG: hypothetical protein CVU46_05395 [Chloroflexi bacterium HGW-Chloroflexi-8]|jgi:hypothetical protein|nr:MAG: hypothetical protein CVU46_05395 [Chloroflexi bacterium HGW-Chloroflexi-8]
MRIGVIGGGPAGIFSALEAKKTQEFVTIIDKNAFLGRKLSSTGAGRGNLTNSNVDPGVYSAFDNFAYSGIIKKYDFDFLVDYFSELGIYTYHTDDGWTYPVSNSARNLSKYLEEVLKQSNVEIILNQTVIGIEKSDSGIQIKLDDNRRLHFDKVIITTGGQAHPQLNASDSILIELKKLGHKIIPSSPALSPILTTKTNSKLLNGVRIDVEVSIMNKANVVANTFGNVIFTEWGLNGPGVMNISHYIAKNQGQIVLNIKFMQKEYLFKLLTLLKKYRNQSVTIEHVLLPFLPQKIIDQLIINSKIDSQIQINQLKEEFVQEFFSNLSIEEKILGTRGFEYSQLSTGAVSSIDVNSNTLESKITPNLYFAGEVLDVIGPCGGYNLHWAFVSGINAGRSV